mgnify:CR=1 FL=1
MKNIQILILLFCGVIVFNSCELDNYAAPSASLSGAIIDQETGEPVQGDIISGTTIELIEHGFENPSIQQIVVKVDGTYRDDMMFPGTYSIIPLRRGNFVSMTDTMVVDIQGETIKNFEVQPYIRILDPDITIDGTRITATFRLEQTVDNEVDEIGLFGHRSPAVGEPLQLGKKTKRVRDVVDPTEVFELVMDVRTDRDFVKGEAYHFRIGALIDADEAEYNYAPAVRLTIPADDE